MNIGPAAGLSGGSAKQQHADEWAHKMQHRLQRLIPCCHGDERPECPIPEGLAGHPA